MYSVPCHYPHQTYDSSLNLEVNRLKLVVTDIKTQNTKLESMLSNLCISMKEMASKYDAILDKKDHEIATLKENIHESTEINDFAERTEIEDNQDLIQSEVISNVENDVPRRYNSCSSSSTSVTDSSSLKSQSTGKSNSTIKGNVEKIQDNKQVITRPNIAELADVNQKRNDRIDSTNIIKNEITYPAGLEVSNGWTYLHLYNVLLGTTVKTVLAHMKSLCGYPDCTVDLLKTRTAYASFKIGVPVEIAEKILKKENWTGSMRIKPWKMNSSPSKTVKEPSPDKSKTDVNDEASIAAQNVTLNKYISNTDYRNSKPDAKEKAVTSTQNLTAKKIVKNTRSVNPKTEDKDKTSTINQKDHKSKTTKPKKK